MADASPLFSLSSIFFDRESARWYVTTLATSVAAFSLFSISALLPYGSAPFA